MRRVSRENSAFQRWLHRLAMVSLAVIPLISAADCFAQEIGQDHSCTAHVAGAFAIPEGADRKNFVKAGWGFQAGGGFAVSNQRNPPGGWQWFITSTFTYQKFKANATALAAAKTANQQQLAQATSAHAGFSAVTLDITSRYTMSRRSSLYGLAGFGWLRRGVGFSGANVTTLLQPGGLSLRRLASNSGVFDAAVGMNYGLTMKGGLMLFIEGRVYRGLAINGGSTLLPVSLGVRW
jgi:hypothetical protein